MKAVWATKSDLFISYWNISFYLLVSYLIYSLYYHWRLKKLTNTHKKEIQSCGMMKETQRSRQKQLVIFAKLSVYLPPRSLSSSASSSVWAFRAATVKGVLSMLYWHYLATQGISDWHQWNETRHLTNRCSKISSFKKVFNIIFSDQSGTVGLLETCIMPDELQYRALIMFHKCHSFSYWLGERWNTVLLFFIY